MRKIGLYTVRGFCMGAADIVPGVSGGTIALLLGIYEDLIDNVGRAAAALGRGARLDWRGALAKLRQVDWAFILPLLAGIGIAIVALASILDHLLEDYPEEMAGLFFGLVAASVVVASRMVQRWIPARAVLLSVVAVGSFLLLGLQSGPAANPSLLAFFGAGAVAICAMILPGISGSFILLMLGMYAAVLDAVNERHLDQIVVFGVGAVIGLALFSSLLQWLLANHHDTLMAALVGLLIGSLRVLWPWPNGVGVISEEADEAVDGTELAWPSSAGDAVLPIVLGLVAFAIVLGLTSAANRESIRHSR